VELGCGDSSKTAVLLGALLRRHGTQGVRFCGVDCSAEALRQTRGSLARLLPQLPQEQASAGAFGGFGSLRALRIRTTGCLPASPTGTGRCMWWTSLPKPVCLNPSPTSTTGFHLAQCLPHVPPPLIPSLTAAWQVELVEAGVCKLYTLL